MSYEKDFLNIHKNEKKMIFFSKTKPLSFEEYWVYTIYKTSPHFAV